jgi:hypothetical protein
MASPYLLIQHIAAAQDQKEVSANAAFDGLDAAINLKVGIPMTDADITLTQLQLAGGFVFVLTGTLTATRNVIVPTVNRVFAIKNSTTGGDVLVKTSAGTGVTVTAAAGYAILCCDGVNVVQLAGSSTGGSGVNFSDAETPSGTINGSNAVFTLAHSPNPAASLILMKNGQIMVAGGVSYTLSGGTITYASGYIPVTGDVHFAWYRY